MKYQKVKILEFPNYEIDTNGCVWNKNGCSIGKHSGMGYVRVSLLKDGKIKNLFVSQLVAKAFIANPENKPSTCHKDNNPSNNNVENIYWGTPKENSEQMVADGRSCPGSKNGNSKLTYEKVYEIRSLLKQGVSQTRIEAIVGIDQTTVSDIKLGKTWKHVPDEELLEIVI